MFLENHWVALLSLWASRNFSYFGTTLASQIIASTCIKDQIIWSSYPTNIYLFIKVVGVILVSLLLTLNRYQTFFGCFHCELWTSKCRLGTLTILYFNNMAVYILALCNLWYYVVVNLDIWFGTCFNCEFYVQAKVLGLLQNTCSYAKFTENTCAGISF